MLSTEEKTAKDKNCWKIQWHLILKTGTATASVLEQCLFVIGPYSKSQTKNWYIQHCHSFCFRIVLIWNWPLFKTTNKIIHLIYVPIPFAETKDRAAENTAKSLFQSTTIMFFEEDLPSFGPGVYKLINTFTPLALMDIVTSLPWYNVKGNDRTILRYC